MKTSNQAMQRTASKPATDVLRVCHPRFGSVASCSGLAVADLASRQMQPLVVALLAAALLIGCERSLDERLIGRWNMPNTDVVITFNANYTFSIVTGSRTTTGTWRAQRNELTMSTRREALALDNIDTHTVEIRGDDLVFIRTSSISQRDGRPFGEPQIDQIRFVYKRAP